MRRLFARLFGIGEDAAATHERAKALAAAGNPAAAVLLWTRLARTGDARAQNALGACFAEGLGVEPDPARARHWLGLAATSGDPVAQRNLAALALRDAGGDAEALRLYRIAAENGDAPAQDMLSLMLLEGIGTAPDPAEARRWAERAAAAGIAAAMTRLGTIHFEARGTPRDPETALRYWRRAADRGDPNAQAALGAALLAGTGATRDPASALAWLLKAQDGGSLLAPRYLPAARRAVAAAEAETAETGVAGRDLPTPT